MHVHDTLESIAERSAWAHRSPLDKGWLCGHLLLLAMVLKPQPWGAVIFLAASLVAVGSAGLSWRSWGRCMQPMMAFIALSALPLLWIDPARVLDVSLRALGAGAAVTLFVATTPAGEALAASSRLRCAAPLVELAYFTLRFGVLFRETAQSVMTAYRCRVGDRPRRRAAFAIQVTASILARSLNRSRRANLGWSSRCQAESLRFWAPMRQSSSRFRWSASAGSLLLLALAFFNGGHWRWQ